MQKKALIVPWSARAGTKKRIESSDKEKMFPQDAIGVEYQRMQCSKFVLKSAKKDQKRQNGPEQIEMEQIKNCPVFASGYGKTGPTSRG